MKNDQLKAALADFVQEHMPWPFDDVSRHDSEGNDAAWDIAERLLPRVAAEFDDIVTSAKSSRRKRQFDLREHDLACGDAWARGRNCQHGVKP